MKHLSKNDRSFKVSLSLVDLCNISAALKAVEIFVHESPIMDMYGRKDLLNTYHYIHDRLEVVNRYFDVQDIDKDFDITDLPF